ncbi:hypothetical protein [Nocardia jejuensis]|uniref:hypothetical protein n=1 Tax=Nocardia jejuensis TaxID=328049 RepID=UPI00083596B9|nr:hypothetical protein [Nocardia jejuensis]
MNTDDNFEDDTTQPQPLDWRGMTHEVFNPDHTAGAACNRDGEIIGLHITDEARENGEVWLAAEILRVARLAHFKSRVALRAEMEFNGTHSHTIDSFDLPTEAAYRAAEAAEFGTALQ